MLRLAAVDFSLSTFLFSKPINRDVLFIDASRKFEQSANQNNLRKQVVEKIVDTHEPKSDIDIKAIQSEIESIEAEQVITIKKRIII